MASNIVRKNRHRQAVEVLRKSWVYAFIGRKLKKRAV
mgnify:CR=1 FL=1